MISPYMTEKENELKTIAEDTLIRAYVPEAGDLTRDEALSLALERDLAAAEETLNSIPPALQLERAAKVAVVPPHVSTRQAQILRELGYS